MNKAEILASLDRRREELLDAIDGLSEEDLLESGVVGEWSVKDLLAHISAWEAELIKLLWQVQQGQKPSSAHFSNKSVDELNAIWHQESFSRPLDRVMADFQAVRRQTARRVEVFSDNELNDNKLYPWLKGQPLWEWVAGDSYEHEAEHTAQILEWRARRE
jgi:hypothetical protein